MEREEAQRICTSQVVDAACRLFDLRRDALSPIADYEGCANLVYEAERLGQRCFLRVSFRPDRNAELIRAELDFVTYLAEHGVHVARPLPSQHGNLMETLHPDGAPAPLHLVTFEQGRGSRVPDNGYRYREGVPIEEYFRSWGQILGQMHALSKDYRPAGGVGRPSWPALHDIEHEIETQVPERLPLVRERIRSLLAQILALPKTRDTYGLIHGDFNDGNFTLDYTNGDFTAFDFDDCCTFWFVYELAFAWESCTGWSTQRTVVERRDLMDAYMDAVMAGYNRESMLPAGALAQLPLFVRLIQVEEFLYFVRYLDDPDADMQAHLAYLIKCIEDEIPYLGFYDPIYSPEHPFRWYPS